MKRFFLLLVAAATVITATSFGPRAADKTDFDLKSLVGSWKGEGVFLMPVSDLEVEIEGAGEFVYDAKRDLIKTAMSGSKFMLSYADSGLLIHHAKTDSISWEIWDNWGKHAKYWGEFRDGKLVADRLSRNRNYQVTVTFPHPDTLDFQLIATEPETQEKSTRARFYLWRVK